MNYTGTDLEDTTVNADLGTYIDSLPGHLGVERISPTTWLVVDPYGDDDRTIVLDPMRDTFTVTAGLPTFRPGVKVRHADGTFYVISRGDAPRGRGFVPAHQLVKDGSRPKFNGNGKHRIQTIHSLNPADLTVVA